MIDSNAYATRIDGDAGREIGTAVAVTRWTARLVDPQSEDEFRVYRFVEDRRRILFMLGVVAVAGVLNFLVELNTYRDGAGSLFTLAPTFASSWLPIVVLMLLSRVRTAKALERWVIACIVFGTVTRLGMLTMHGNMSAMWPAMMLAFVFVIYLYLPIRLSAAVVLSLAFSIVGPTWWRLTEGAALPTDVFYRGLIWLSLANTLGYIAANSLQRSQRMQFAQGLVLRQLLSTDALTGIANRRRFDAALEREWRRCRRAQAPISLLMIDVDHFKAYNDHYGHLLGDSCLREVARLMLDATGRPGDLVARLGGEEFVCLMPETTMAGALAVANKLQQVIREADIAHPRSRVAPRLTVSIGVATAKNLEGSPESLVGCADKLLYAAKAAGRNQNKVGQLTGAGTIATAA